MAQNYKMRDIKEKPQKPTKISGGYYPSISLTDEQIKELKELALKDKVTFHAHGIISSTSKYNNEPTRYTVELRQADVKPGYNPYPNMPKSLWGKMERCVARVKRQKGSKNAYGICYDAIMGAHKKDSAQANRKAVQQVGK